MRILILKPSSLGDVVHALPVLRLIKKAHPHAEVYWWISSGLAPLLASDPDIKELFLFERNGWNTANFWVRKIRETRRMRSMKFDYVLDLQGLARSALPAWLANGGLTIGLDSGREGAAGFYDVAVKRPSESTHAVDWYLEVLRPLGIPVHNQFEWIPRRDLAEPYPDWLPNKAPKIILNPGARWDNKRWPVENFAALAQKFIIRYGLPQISVLGDKGDGTLGHFIQARGEGTVQDLTGQTTLGQMVEIIRDCDLMVTNDTGPMHIAAALKRPVISLFGPTNSHRTGPYHQRDRVLQTPLGCVPCMRADCRNPVPLACLKSISVEAVFRASESILGAT